MSEFWVDGLRILEYLLSCYRNLLVWDLVLSVSYWPCYNTVLLRVQRSGLLLFRATQEARARPFSRPLGVLRELTFLLSTTAMPKRKRDSKKAATEQPKTLLPQVLCIHICSKYDTDFISGLETTLQTTCPCEPLLRPCSRLSSRSRSHRLGLALPSLRRDWEDS